MDLLRSSRGAHLEHINHDVVVIAVALTSVVRLSFSSVRKERLKHVKRRNASLYDMTDFVVAS